MPTRSCFASSKRQNALPHRFHPPFSLSLFFHTHPLAAGGYKVVDGAANDATINEAAKFAVESVRIVLEYFLLVV